MKPRPFRCSGLVSYFHDRFGNRWQQNAPQGGCTFTATYSGGNNRIDSATHDASGNVTKDPTTGANYTFDAENRITTVNGGAGSGGVTYTYDADSQRVEKNVNGVKTDYVYDLGGQAIAEISGSGTVNRQELFAGGKHLGTYTNNTTYFSHGDRLGSERVRSDMTGAPCETIQNLPFGDGQIINGGDPSTRHFTGKERDVETGLDFFGARYYGNSMGEFLTTDWLDIPDSVPYADFDFPQSLNLYGYVRNNPVANVDLDGHDCVVQTRTGDNSETVTVSLGNCDNVKVGDGQSKTYVPGTVNHDADGNASIRLGQDGKSIDIGYTPYEGGGTGVFNAAEPYPDRRGLAFGFNQEGYHALGVAGATMNDPRTYALWYGVSALGGLGFIGSGAIRGEAGLTTLAGEDGLGLVSNQAINRMIGTTQRELLKQFFKSGKLPQGLSQRTLQLYKTVAERAIAAGKDQLGVQAQRLQMINNALH